MTTDDQRQECVNLIALQTRKSAEWRFILAEKYNEDERNLIAARKLAEIATAATEIPDDIWEGLKDHYNHSKQKFGEAVSTTNRNIVFRCSVSDFPSYTRNLLLNVRSAFTI